MPHEWLPIVLILPLVILAFLGSRMVVFGSMLELLHLRRRKRAKLWTKEILKVQTK